MRKLLSAAVILTALFACGFADAEYTAYQTRNVFYANDSVTCVASANGMLYALRGSGLYRIATDETETRIASANALDDRMYTILSDGNAVYGLVSGGTLILCLLVDESGSFINQRVFETDMFAGVFLQNPVVKNGTLFFMSANGKQTQIATYSFADGEAKTVSLDGILCFDVMEDGRIIALRRETHWPDSIATLITITPDTGEATVWADVEAAGVITRIAYDSAADTAYLFARSEIFAVRQGGSLEPVDSFIAGDVIAAVLLPSGAALVVDDSLIIRNFAGAEQETARRLAILEPYGRGEEYRDFLTANPGVDLVFMGSDDRSGEERFIQDMATRSADIDVYVLSDTNLLSYIKQKGFYTDMAQSPAIQTLVNRMYAPLRSAYTLETQTVAFPKETFFEMLCYHRETFRSLGIAPPVTYEAYFDFCLAWLDSYADTYPDITLNPFANNIGLETLLARYADERARNDQSITYNTGIVKRTIEKYQAVQVAADKQDDLSANSTPLFYSYAIPCLGAEDGYAYLPLTFEAGAEVAVTPQEGDFSYFVVNPYSDNTQDALALVASYDAARTGCETALLYEDTGGAIENAEYQSELARLHETLDMLETSSAQADSDDVKNLQEQIAAQKKRIAAYEKESRWAVSPGAITFYKEHADWLYINPFNPLTSLLNALGSGELRLLREKGSTDIEALLAELDRRTGMMALEDGAQ